MHRREKEPRNIYQKNYVLLVKLNNIVREKEATEAKISDLEKVPELGLKCKKTIKC